MTQEVLLEVVNQVNGLVEEFLVLATVHQNGFCAKHFRHLCQDACTALCNEPVAEFTYQWVGCNSAEAVRTATLQTYAQLAYRNFLALVFLSHGIEIAQNLHAFLQLIAFNLLCYKKFDAVVVVISEHLHEIIWLVVLAAERENEHGTCVRMQTDVAKHLTGILMVAREL